MIKRTMRPALMVAALFFLAGWGCSTGKAPDVPPMPKYQTRGGRACARQCQQTYAQCARSFSVALGVVSRETGYKQCATNQGACYASCKQDEK